MTIFDETTARRLAGYLLDCQAVKLSPTDPFTWTSGWKSPIYCDNRITLSFPEIRTFIKLELTRAIVATFPAVEVVAGVATAGIAQGALVADEIGLPFVYVRSEAKKHGMKNLIEGYLQPGQQVVVVEDLISTGLSSLRAAENLKEAGAEVEGLISVFSYGFSQAADSIAQSGIQAGSLTNFEQLILAAQEKNMVSSTQLETLMKWKNNPENWNV